MRTPIVILAGTLLVACASGTRVVYVPAPASSAPAPTPAPPPARVIPAPMPPVGVTIVRIDDNRMLVSTNQPAYLAAFEIVPNRGVTLVYPASPAQRQLALAGSNWLNVSWRSARGLMDDDMRDARGRRHGRPLVHHVYVVASERPLRLTSSAFDDRTLAAMLGARLTQAADPYETMAALSRRFVPPGRDEDWGEDVYTMDVARPVVVRVAKIYCPDGSVVYARDEMIDRSACPWQSQGRNAPVPRPDSVVASNGRRVPRPMQPGGVAQIFRIPAPADAPATRPTTGGDVADGRPGNGNGNGAANGNDGRNGNDDAANGRDNPKGNNGNHYGWGNGNGNGNGNAGKDGNTGGTVANGGNANGNDGKDKGNNGNHYGQEKNGNNGNNGNGNNGNANGQSEVQQQGKPERATPVQPSEPKPVEVKPAEVKPAEAKPAEVKPDPTPKQEQPDAKQEPKQENRGMHGVMDRIRAKADSADAKKGKPDRD